MCVMVIPLVLMAFYGNKTFSCTRTQREHNNLMEIDSAVRSYQTELNEEPPAGSADFFNSLRGNNPKGINFLVPDRTPTSHSGIRCDSWKNPYQVFRGTDGWLIRSAGPNKTFDDLSIKGLDDMTVLIPTIASKKAEQGADGKPPEAAQPPHQLNPNTRLP